MTDLMSIGGYWTSRPTEREWVYERLLRMLGSLSQSQEWLRSWYLVADSRAAAMDAVLVESGRVLPTAVRLLRRRISVKDDGVVQGVWNGLDGDAGCQLIVQCRLSVSCVVSSVGMRMVRRRDRVWPDAGAVRGILYAIVDTWDPDWAVATDPLLREAIEASPGSPRIGWMTYSSDRKGAVPSLPEVETVPSFAGRGTLIVTGEAMPDASSVADIARLKRAFQRMADAGLVSTGRAPR